MCLRRHLRTLSVDVSYDKSKEITDLINHGDLLRKSGWIRISLYPKMTNEALYFTLDVIKQVQEYHQDWGREYIHNYTTNEFRYNSEPEDKTVLVKDWFDLED